MSFDLLFKVSCAEVFFLILMIKWGIVKYYQLYRLSWMPQRCNFCMFFWLSIIYIITQAIIEKHAVKIDLLMGFDVICLCIMSLVIFSIINNEIAGSK
jgi:hypothetical protein